MFVSASTWAIEVDGINYNLYDDGKAEVIAKEYSGTVIIPAEIIYEGKTYSVTSIGNNAFKSCTGLTSVTIPNSVTSIGNHAFHQCTKLTSVIIPNSVTSIGICAFYQCSNLTSVTIPNGVTSIASCAFLDCFCLTSATIPNSITSIGSSAFQSCISLKSVTIPNSVTSIGIQAFHNCSGLTSVTIPNSVKYIDDFAFSGCSGLTSVTIPNSVTSIGVSAFSGCSLTSIKVENGNTIYDSRDNCNAIIKTATNTILSGCRETIIPNSVTSIGKNAFEYCKGLTSITIPNSVTSIGSNAFSACGLTSIKIPNSVTSIDYQAFYNCRGLTSVSIGNSVTSIGNNAFYGCGLTSIKIPNSVTYIGDYAFQNCSGLTSVSIGNSVTSIGKFAFDGCSGLTSFTLEDSEKVLSFVGGYNTFVGCPIEELYMGRDISYSAYSPFEGNESLKSLTIHNCVTSISNDAFFGCSSLTSITIPNSVTDIGSSAFSGCSGLTTIIIPNSVTGIGSSAFQDCSNLTTVRIGNNITEIPSRAFNNCTNLTSVVIGDGVSKIKANAFSGDKNLETIISISPTPPNIITSPSSSVDGNPFEAITYKHAVLKVPLGCKSRYWSAKYWEDFAYIEEMDMTAYRNGVDMEEGDKPSLYASFYDSQSAYALPMGMKASVVTGLSKGKLVYKVIAEGGKTNNVVPKGVAVMLTSQTDDASAYTLTPTESAATYTDTNWLHGSDLATTTTADGGNYWFYKLSYGASGSAQSDVFGWYWGAANGGAFSIAGHKAWLAVPKAAGAPVRSFAFDGEDIGWDETTDIENVEVKTLDDDAYYDLQGRRIEKPTMRGIYIHNGKKIMIK